jgi:hypothetical protein
MTGAGPAPGSKAQKQQEVSDGMQEYSRVPAERQHDGMHSLSNMFQ